MRTIEGSDLSSKELALVEPSETAIFAARPSYATVNGRTPWSTPLLVLTDQRLILSRGKTFGKQRADFAAGWGDVSAVDGAPFGTDIQLVVRCRRADIELIVPPVYAVDVESAIREGYVR